MLRRALGWPRGGPARAAPRRGIRTVAGPSPPTVAWRRRAGAFATLYLPLALAVFAPAPAAPAPLARPVSPTRAPELRQTLESSAPADGNNYGFSVALSSAGDVAVIGEVGAGNGAVEVWPREAGNFTLPQRLGAPGLSSGDQLGWAVAADGDWFAASAPGAADTITDAGLVHVYRRDAGTWAYSTTLRAPDPDGFDRMGDALAIDGDVIVAGAPNRDGAGPNSGIAYVFERDPVSGTWGSGTPLQQPAPASADLFGTSVAVQGNVIAVGAPLRNVPTADAGAVYVFTRGAMGWTLAQQLIAGDGANGDQLGTSVAIDGDTIVAGAYADDDLGDHAGSAYVFVRGATDYAFQAKLLAPDGAAGDAFGERVAISGDRVVVGAPRSAGISEGPGAVYVYERSGTTWSAGERFLTTTVTVESRFGSAVALRGSTALVGAYLAEIGGNDRGFAYHYNVAGGLGEPCTTVDDCQSAACVDGVCCNDACGGGDPNDCQTCAGAPARPNGICGPVVADAVCRAAAGECDAEEACDGTALSCPPDAGVMDGSTCTQPGGAAGVCMAGACEPDSGTGSTTDTGTGTSTSVGTDSDTTGGSSSGGSTASSGTGSGTSSGTGDPTAGTTTSGTGSSGASASASGSGTGSSSGSGVTSDDGSGGTVGTDGAGTSGAASDDGGCSCSSTPSSGAAGLWVLAVLGGLARRRRASGRGDG